MDQVSAAPYCSFFRPSIVANQPWVGTSVSWIDFFGNGLFRGTRGKNFCSIVMQICDIFSFIEFMLIALHRLNLPHAYTHIYLRNIPLKSIKNISKIWLRQNQNKIRRIILGRQIWHLNFKITCYRKGWSFNQNKFAITSSTADKYTYLSNVLIFVWRNKNTVFQMRREYFEIFTIYLNMRCNIL